MKNIRPICKECNKNYRAVNYIKKGITHYRSICDECGSKKPKAKTKQFTWQKAGYKKKTVCDCCGSFYLDLWSKPSCSLSGGPLSL